MGKYYCILFLAATPLSPSRTHERLFELTAFRGPSTCLERSFRNSSDTSTPSGISTKVPVRVHYQGQGQLVQTLILCLLKSH